MKNNLFIYIDKKAKLDQGKIIDAVGELGGDPFPITDDLWYIKTDVSAKDSRDKLAQSLGAPNVVVIKSDDAWGNLLDPVVKLHMNRVYDQ